MGLKLILKPTPKGFSKKGSQRISSAFYDSDLGNGKKEIGVLVLEAGSRTVRTNATQPCCKPPKAGIESSTHCAAKETGLKTRQLL